MAKLTSMEKSLRIENNRLKKQIEELLKDNDSLRWDVSMYKRVADELKKRYFSRGHFLLEEVGFETSMESEGSLIAAANFHCKSYSDRDKYLPINTVDEAIDYFENNGFKVFKVQDSE